MQLPNDHDVNFKEIHSKKKHINQMLNEPCYKCDHSYVQYLQCFRIKKNNFLVIPTLNENR